MSLIGIDLISLKSHSCKRFNYFFFLIQFLPQQIHLEFITVWRHSNRVSKELRVMSEYFLSVCSCWYTNVSFAFHCHRNYLCPSKCSIGAKNVSFLFSCWFSWHFGCIKKNITKSRMVDRNLNVNRSMCQTTTTFFPWVQEKRKNLEPCPSGLEVLSAISAFKASQRSRRATWLL